MPPFHAIHCKTSASYSQPSNGVPGAGFPAKVNDSGAGFPAKVNDSGAGFLRKPRNQASRWKFSKAPFH